MTLSNLHVKNVCLLKQGNKQCRYLNYDDMSGYQCVKLVIDKKKLADNKVRNHILECRKDKKDVKDTNMPMGNNCQGYPKFNHLVQGYDS